MCGPLIFSKAARAASGGKKRSFQHMVLEQLRNISKRIKLEPDLASDTKINWEWTRYLNIKVETIRLLEENGNKSS